MKDIDIARNANLKNINPLYPAYQTQDMIYYLRHSAILAAMLMYLNINFPDNSS